MANVKLSQVTKQYENGFKAVHGIDLDIHEGEFMVFVGPSGCAKSTTLRMIAGLESISGGEIRIGNQVVNDLPPKERGIAMVFQNYALYPHKTVYDNMAFGLKMQKRPKAEIDRRVREAAEKLEITDLLDRKPKEMSGGQRQRVAVGRAIVRKPDVFLFDEPLSNLDAKLRVSMRVKIAQLHQQLKEEGNPATMIYVTHDQTEALTLGDRICVLNSGQIMQVDTPVNLYNYPRNRFVAGFIGSPAMNLIEVYLRKQGETYYVDLGTDKLIALPARFAGKLDQYVDQKVCFGLRPEHISIQEGDGIANALPARISVIENMGNEKYVYFDVAEYQMISRIHDPLLSMSAINSEKQFVLDTEFSHIFDIATGDNLTLD